MVNLAEAVNERLDVVNMVEVSEGRFLIQGKIPIWLLWFEPELKPSTPFVLSDIFLFFETYLDEVRQELSDQPAAVTYSGPWSEPDSTGVERHLFASGFLIQGQLGLQIRLIADSRRYHQEVFQKAREYSMAYERLVKEKEHREVLIHTIVHDLAGPLTSIFGALDLLRENPSRTDLIEVALSQANVQKQMIESILEAFSAEFTEFDPATVSQETAPRLRTILAEQVEIFLAAFEAQGVKLMFVDEASHAGDLPVTAELDYLERVLSNLLENALRYSPSGTTTEVRLNQTDGRYTVAICDQGKGVDPELKPQLFEQFTGGLQFGGKQGLGLYFCRIAVGRWGQSIWCESPTANEADGTECGTNMVFTLEPFDQSVRVHKG